MKPNLVSISEEIVRWNFEISVNRSDDWFIAFTNPTAGPWKRITAPDDHGKIGEVHRFEVVETRPDLILVNDKTQDVWIIEAKTTFNDLSKPAQLAKTSQLFEDLTNKLQNMSNNDFWGLRSSYKYSLGLLWSSADESAAQILDTCRDYLKNIGRLTKDIICIQGYVEDDLLKSKVYKAISGEVLKITN
jgi:hypothetical protein